MLEQYQNKERISLNDLKNLYANMAFDGDWRPAMEKIAYDYKTIDLSMIENVIPKL